MGATQAVVGASDHYGRAELVTLEAQAAGPVLLDRRRVELIDSDLPIAPYHHEALELDRPAASELVDKVRASVAECARASLSNLLAAHRAQVLVLPASPYDELPDSLDEVLRSRPLTHAADGMLYRESLAEAGLELGLEVRRYPRKSDPTTLAAKAMGVDPDAVRALIAEFGRAVGPPWRKDHKLAAAAALWVVGPRLRD